MTDDGGRHAGPRSYAFARKPIWLAGAAIAVVMASLFVVLGMWQLRRHEERRELNAVFDSRLEAPIAQLATVEWDDPEAFRYRRVEASGTYDGGSEVVVRNRSFRGSSGYHLVVPLLLASGDAVLVDRGFVSLAAGDAGEYAPPRSGPVVVTGILLVSERRGTFGPRDPPEGILDRVSRIDVARIQQQSAVELLPGFLLLQVQAPARTASDPLPAEPPDPGRGRHFGYALQWFLFAATVLVGFGLLLRRTARQRGVVERPA